MNCDAGIDGGPTPPMVGRVAAPGGLANTARKRTDRAGPSAPRARPVEIPPNRRGAQLAVAGDLPAGAERKLAIQVLATAIDDVVRHRDANGRAAQAAYHQARAWFVSGDRSWPYSFLNLCDLLNLPADRLRRAALSRKTLIRLFDDSLAS